VRRSKQQTFIYTDAGTEDLTGPEMSMLGGEFKRTIISLAVEHIYRGLERSIEVLIG
jgi:hypothetical protein